MRIKYATAAIRIFEINEIFNKRGHSKQTEAFRSNNNFTEQFPKRNSL